jgi:hypothetical protein
MFLAQVGKCADVWHERRLNRRTCPQVEEGGETVFSHTHARWAQPEEQRTLAATFSQVRSTWAASCVRRVQHGCE